MVSYKITSKLSFILPDYAVMSPGFLNFADLTQKRLFQDSGIFTQNM
jgi:hypothetical protein